MGGEISGTQAVTHLLDSAAPLHLPELTTGGPPRARFDGREGGGGLEAAERGGGGAAGAPATAWARDVPGGGWTRTRVGGLPQQR